MKAFYILCICEAFFVTCGFKTCVQTSKEAIMAWFSQFQIVKSIYKNWEQIFLTT
jgi:hypothetical protein